MKIKATLVIAIVFTLLSCKNYTKSNIVAVSEHKKSNNSEEHPHWTYMGETGPEHWAEIEKQSSCEGKRQSPVNIIDIDATNDSSLNPITINYSNDVKIHDVTNNGHSIQYSFEKGDNIVVDGNKKELVQIHFHEPSEHTLNGVRFPLEMHMVHVGSDNKIAVLSVMATEGKNSEPFTFLEKYLPLKTGETKPVNTKFDLNLNLPENKSYYTYDGSLTTPPCSEGVSWFVFKTPITISVDQVKQLQKQMPLNNYRNEQPLNGRKIRQLAQ